MAESTKAGVPLAEPVEKAVEKVVEKVADKLVDITADKVATPPPVAPVAAAAAAAAPPPAVAPVASVPAVTPPPATAPATSAAPPPSPLPGPAAAPPPATMAPSTAATAAPGPSAGVPRPAAVPPVTPVPERVVYGCSAARGTIFSLLFLLLLPFFVSIPAMLYMRVSHGLVQDTFGLSIIGIAFAVLMFLVLVEMLYSIRTRVDLGEKAVRLTLPTGGGPTPMLRYATHEIPYDQIKAVETRREIYGGRIAPVLMRGARLVTKEGKPVRLGYVNEANVDPALPYHEIASEIARRAGVVMVDKGNVRRRVTNKILGIASTPDAGNEIEERDIEVLNRGHTRIMVALITGLVALIGLGIANDFAEERSPTVVVQPAPKAKGVK